MPQDLYVDEEQVRKGLLMLWIALAGSVLMVPALLSSKLMVLFLISWVASFLGGIGGLREVARGTQGSSLLMILAMVAVFMPLLNVVAIGLYLLIGRAALKRVDFAPEAVEAPRAARPAPAAFKTPDTPEAKRAAAAATWSQQRLQAGGARAYVSSAIASIKQAGLRSADGGDLKEGSRLGIRLQLPEGAPKPNPMDEPIMRVAHGTFGIAYLVDLGDHYTWVTVGKLVEAKLTLDELHRIGVENLARKANELGIMEGDDAQMLSLGGEFEASLLLVDSLWEKGGALADYTPNGPVVAIPARDVCAFCDARSAKGLEAVCRVAANPLAEPKYALTPTLFTRVGGRWQALGAEPAKRTDLPPLEFR